MIKYIKLLIVYRMKSFFSSKIFSVAMVVALAISLPVTAYILVNRDFELRISAFDSDEPREVIISDVRDTSFRVTWLTEKNAIGGIRLANDPASPLFEEESVKSHSLRITNLSPDTKYSFTMLSNGTSWNEMSVTTASVNSNQGVFLVYGQVFSKDGVTFQHGGEVELTLEQDGRLSQNVSAILNEAGGYQIDLGGLLTKDLSGSFDYRNDVLVHVVVHSEVGVDPIEKDYQVNLTATRQLPNIYLGDASIDVIPGVSGE